MYATRFSRVLITILGATFFTLILLAVLALPASNVQAQFVSPKAHTTISGTVTIWHAYIPGGSEEAAFMQVVTNARTANPGVTITAVHIPFDQIFTL